MDYCHACRAEFEKRQEAEHERNKANQRKWYAQRKARPKWEDAYPDPPAEKPRTARQAEPPRLIKVQLGSLISRVTNRAMYSVSGLQAAILTTALTKRVPDARGCDVSQGELLAEVWGWKPRRVFWVSGKQTVTAQLRWTAEEARTHDAYRVGDPVPLYSMGERGVFSHISRAEYRSARACLSRALSRLHKRKLVEFVNGNGLYSDGMVLTPTGEEVGRLLLRTGDDNE
jgi:hypothetical protein